LCAAHTSFGYDLPDVVFSIFGTPEIFEVAEKFLVMLRGLSLKPADV